MNNLLEKLAANHAKRIAGDAIDLVKHHPLPTIFGADGAIEGASDTHHKGNEHKSRTVMRGIQNTVSGAVSGVATGTVLEYGHKYLMNKQPGRKMANKYLEKAASMHDVKHLAKATGQLMKANPVTSALGIAGAADGALKTTHKKDESYLRTALRGVRNIAVGGATGAAIGKTVEVGISHIKGKAGVN